MIFDDLTTRILGAVLAGDQTVTTIAKTVDSDWFTVHGRLEILRGLGLVTWRGGPSAKAHPPVIA